MVITETAGGIEIETELPRRKGLSSWLGSGGASVTYEIRVPRTVAVKARTVNGNVAIEEVAGAVEARSTNGRIRLTEVAGPAEGRTTNGSVNAEMSQVGGQIRLSSTNGAIRLALPRGEGVHLDAKTVNGRVRLDSQLGLHAERRGKRFSGALFGGGERIDVSTVNGSITIDVDGSTI